MSTSFPIVIVPAVSAAKDEDTDVNPFNVKSANVGLLEIPSPNVWLPTSVPLYVTPRVPWDGVWNAELDIIPEGMFVRSG